MQSAKEILLHFPCMFSFRCCLEITYKSILFKLIGCLYHFLLLLEDKAKKMQILAFQKQYDSGGLCSSLHLLYTKMLCSASKIIRAPFFKCRFELNTCIAASFVHGVYHAFFYYYQRTKVVHVIVAQPLQLILIGAEPCIAQYYIQQHLPTISCSWTQLLLFQFSLILYPSVIAAAAGSVD